MARWFLLTLLAAAVGGSVVAGEEAQPARRPPLTTSRVQGRPEPPPPFRPERVFPRLKFDKATVLATAKGTERFFIAEQGGKLFSVSPTAKNRSELAAADPFLDVQELLAQLNRTAPEPLALEAVYGLEFDPEFERNHYCYLCYVVRRQKGGGQLEGGTRVSRLTVVGDPPRCDPASEQLVISWLQGGHNGGCLKFGPEGCLYISTGDGGFAFPPDGLKSGQDLATLLAKILRIDPRRSEAGRAYAIPADNPFVKQPGARGEIWAYGVRNPWKMSFDRGTGALWVGDVGWELWELVYRVQKGDNFGWSVVEGRQSVHPTGARGPTPIVPPTIEVPHTDGASITGGFVYRGQKFPELTGHYIFGDWETRRIWSVPTTAKNLQDYRELVDPVVRIVDFAEDAAGELYLLDHDDGAIYALERNPPPSARERFPLQLSETGLFSDVAAHQPAPGVAPFVINAPQWSDHAHAERWIAVPGDEPIRLHPAARPAPGSMFSRQLDFPLNTVLLKTLSLDLVQGDPSTRKRIETQLLHFDGREWLGYSYRWNDAQTDAELVGRAGETVQLKVRDAAAPGGVREQAWRFVSRSECIRCHNPWSEYALAFNIPQLNRPHDRVNQITRLRASGLLADVLDYDPAHPDQPLPPVPPERWPALAHWPREAGVAGPAGGGAVGAAAPKAFARVVSAAELGRQARAYLHANCAHCHRFNGGGASYFYLPHDLSLAETKLLGGQPTQGTFGFTDPQLATPGDPYRSLLYYRLAKLGPGHMPRLGAELVDTAGLQLIHDWLRSLPSSPAAAHAWDRLWQLDEAAARTREQADAPRLAWRLARRKAEAAGRAQPSEKELQDAVAQVKNEQAAALTERRSDREQLLAELLATPSSALTLAHALAQQELPPGLREPALAAARAAPDPAVRDLFEAYLPLAERTQRLGEAIDIAALLARPGDAARGRALFHTSQVVQCRNCHQVAGQGTELGPPLDAIGKKYDRAKLLESLLEPSKQIDPKYQAYLVQTTAGVVQSGLLVERNAELLVLRDAQNKEHRFATRELETVAPQTRSFMPDGLLKEFTAEQAADLLAYLASLQGQGGAKAP